MLLVLKGIQAYMSLIFVFCSDTAMVFPQKVSPWVLPSIVVTSSTTPDGWLLLLVTVFRCMLVLAFEILNVHIQERRKTRPLVFERETTRMASASKYMSGIQNRC